MNYKDEAVLQTLHHKTVLRTAESSSVSDFINDDCDWVLFAGNRTTVKIQPDRYDPKNVAYITQTKHSGSNNKPVTLVHKDCVEAIEHAKQCIRSGGKNGG